HCVEPPEELDAGPGEDQATVFDAGDSEHAARLQHALDLQQPVERSVERLEHRVAETGVEAAVGKVEAVDARDAELDVLDAVLVSIAARRLELVLGVNADE